MPRRPLALLLLLLAAAAAFGAAPAQSPAASPPGPPAETGSAREEPAIIEELATAYRFENDGTGHRQYRVTIAVKTQAGVDAWGTLTFPYMSAVEEVSIRELTVEKPDGRRVEAKDAPLEDVTATGQVDEPIVTDLRMKKVAVPALQPGDRLRYDVLIRRTGSLIPGQFWMDHSFARTAVVLNETLEVDVPGSRPLSTYARRGSESHVPSPPAGRRILRWTNSQASPIDPADPAADREAAEDEKNGPDVRVSSFAEWSQVARWFGGLVSTRVEPDETVRAKALELTRGIESPEEKLRALFSFVSTKIRYVSLAFGLGRYEPRSPAQVLATAYGDCKDKHVLLASLARGVGLNLSAVLVSSGALLEERVPSPGQFDHVVSVRVAGDPTQWVWMDSTSGLLPPGALLSPFRDRKALLAAEHSPATSALVTTPASLPTASGLEVEIHGGIQADGTARTRVVRRMFGDNEYLMRMLLRGANQQVLNRVGQELSQQDGIRNAAIEKADFRDDGPGAGVTLSYDASHKYTLPLGKPWEMWVPTPQLTVIEPQEHGDTELGGRARFAVTARYDLPEGTGARPPVPISLERPFAKYASTYRVEGNVLVIERSLETAVKAVAPGDLDAYRAFRKAIDADYRQVFAIDALAAAPSESASAADLNAAGYEAIEKGDYSRALDLLKRAVSIDPKHKEAWNNLARAHIGTNNLAAAFEALQRQVKVNPYSENAYGNMGHVRHVQGRLDEAIVHFRKQIEVSPLHAYSHGELGRVYAQREQHDEAETWLDKAVSLSPKNANLWLDLGRARLALNKEEAAITALERSVELAPNPITRNNVAWALAEKGVRLDDAEKHVRVAIDMMSAVLNTVSLEDLKAPALVAVDSLSAYWDTLGWVYFQRGDPSKAEPWLEAAWVLSDNAENAEHLGTLYERRGERERAIRTYAQGLASSNRPQLRAALERLVGPGKVEETLAAGRKALADAKVIRLTTRPAQSGVGDFYLLVESGRIAGTRPISGDPQVHANAKALVGLEVPVGSPDGRPLRLVRQGVVDCSGQDACFLSLIPSPLTRRQGLPMR